MTIVSKCINNDEINQDRMKIIALLPSQTPSTSYVVDLAYRFCSQVTLMEDADLDADIFSINFAAILIIN